MKKLLTIMLFSVSVIAASVTIGSAEDKGDAAKGKVSYDNTCVACHGPEGKGDGVAAAALDPKPRDLSDPAYVSTLSNEHLYKVISEGGASVGLSPLMAAWGGVLSEQDTWNVIAYIRQDVCKCQYDGN
ncbi:MAG: cytochrome c [Deltaproteobacteria bacterium]|nr:cytochrome c [Deltaproteobacteria bacterium]MCK5709697.1 cytochrome c [Deltaproteobacteria bacterium]